MKIYTEKQLKKMTLEEIENVFHEFGDFAEDYSHLVLRILEEKGG